MSEEYLWDKTGSDTEIEELEALLNGFAYKEQAPPPLPAKVLALPDPRPRRFFGFGLRSALALACVAIVSLTLGWLVFTRSPSIAPVTVVTNTPRPAEVIVPDQTTRQAVPSDDVRPMIVKTGGQPIRRHAAATKLSSKNRVRETAPKLQQPKFTDEELYAYNQLMIALSITSSKLKIVKDKVNGTDGQGSDLTTTR